MTGKRRSNIKIKYNTLVYMFLNFYNRHIIEKDRRAVNGIFLEKITSTAGFARSGLKGILQLCAQHFVGSRS